MTLLLIFGKNHYSPVMNRLLIFSLCLGLMIGLSSCPGSIFNKRHGKFQATPVNLDVINSDTDDYNSDLPRNRYGHDYLLFSSKRDRRDKFNLVLKPLALAYDDTRQLTARIVHSGWGQLAQDEYYYERLIEKANQDCNVLGPVMYTLYEQELTNPSIYEKGKHLLLYADDSKGGSAN
ncbi:hypothetical protein [Telluribacter humicola]|uniref:hypothetical protein n=1 Tax=Telluribacter humicola TaxID=1720261 RepID=UPI001A9742AB|nr:hypothetical protein [Telluribacter humicola]